MRLTSSERRGISVAVTNTMPALRERLGDQTAESVARTIGEFLIQCGGRSEWDAKKANGVTAMPVTREDLDTLGRQFGERLATKLDPLSVAVAKAELRGMLSALWSALTPVPAVQPDQESVDYSEPPVADPDATPTLAAKVRPVKRLATVGADGEQD